MSAIFCSERKTDFINTFANELLLHHRDPKNSDQKTRINKYINTILAKEYSWDGCSKQDLLGLRRAIFVLPKDDVSNISRKIFEKLPAMMTSSSERRIYRTRSSMNNFWENYDAIARLFLPSEIEESLLQSVYNELSLKRDRMISLKEVIEESSQEKRRFLFASVVNNLFVSDSYDLLIVQAIKEIPAEQRRDVIEKAQSLFTKAMLSRERSAILKNIGQIPRKERDELINQVKSLFHKDLSPVCRVSVLQAMIKIPRAERNDVIKYAKSLFSSCVGDESRSRTIEAIWGLPQEERKDVVDRAKSLLTGDVFDGQRAILLKTIANIPQKERFDVINRGQKFFRQDSPISHKNFILKFIYAIPLENRGKVVKQGGVISGRNMKEAEERSFLAAIEKINRDERVHVIELAEQLLNRDMDGNQKAVIIEAIGKIFPGERNDVVSRLISLLVEGNTVNEQVALLEMIQEIPMEERAKVIAISEKLFRLTTAVSEKIKIMSGVAAVPDSEREILESNQDRRIIKELTHNCITKSDAILLFYLLPFELRNFDQLLHVRIIGRKRLWDIFEYRTAIIASLERKVVNETFLPLTHRKLARFIYEYKNYLMLHEEHPLMQHALEVVTAMDNVNNERNPALIYRKLKYLRQQPSDFSPSPQLVQDINLQISMDKLKNVSSNSKITRKDLPQEATIEAWNHLINRLKVKIDLYPEATKALEECGTTWTSIWGGSLGDPYLSGLLTLSCEKVPLAEAKFRAILSNILAKDSSRPDPVFTEQEDVLIKTAMSIQHCTGGKQEGIDAAYRLLDPVYHYSVGLNQGSMEEDQRERAVEFIDTSVRKVIGNEVGANTPFMQEVVGVKDIKQGSHQSIYVKNLIGHLIGLDHELVFDRHTFVLYQSLIEKTREEILKLLFTHITPQKMVNELVGRVNRAVDLMDVSPKVKEELSEKDKDLIDALKIVSPFVSEDGWDLQDDCLTVKLNEFGALDLLQMAGYITPVPAILD